MVDRYLVSKGWEGFCDRLQCLSHSIILALRYNRVLFVDWSDRIWSHDARDFYSYFELVDLPYVTSISQIPDDLEVFPRFWRHSLEIPADKWVYKLKEELVFDPQVGYHFEPVWVHPGIGFRTFNYSLLSKHLRLRLDIVNILQALLANIPPDLPVVHLRGTDRDVPENRWAFLREAAPVACVVSDDVTLAQRWMQESPNSLLISDTLVEGRAKGHQLSAATLKRIGIEDKHRMNIQLLADFVVISCAKNAYALNEESYFFKVSRQIGAVGGIQKMFLPAPMPFILPTHRKNYTFQFRSSTTLSGESDINEPKKEDTNN
jgi:hypothetical protein